MRFLNSRLVVVAGMLLVAACGVFGPTEERIVGELQDGGPHPDPVTVRDSVNVGQPFGVSVLTFGDSCVRGGETEVEVAGLGATVTPFDYRLLDADCGQSANYFEHPATITFSESGTGRIRVVGSNQTLLLEVVVR